MVLAKSQKAVQLFQKKERAAYNKRAALISIKIFSYKICCLTIFYSKKHTALEDGLRYYFATSASVSVSPFNTLLTSPLARSTSSGSWNMTYGLTPGMLYV